MTKLELFKKKLIQKVLSTNSKLTKEYLKERSFEELLGLVHPYYREELTSEYNKLVKIEEE